MLSLENCSDIETQEADGAMERLPGCSALRISRCRLDRHKRSNLMEGFIALAVFAKQMSDSQEKHLSTQHEKHEKEDRSTSNRDKVAPLTRSSKRLRAVFCLFSERWQKI